MGKPLTEANFLDAESKRAFRELKAAAEALRNAAKKPLPGQPKPTFNQLRVMKETLERERQEWINERAAAKCDLLNAGCFAAGTKLWTPQGYRAIEDLRIGDMVYSRDEWDESGDIVAKVVEDVFTRYTVVLHLQVGGQVIRTTGEHPFFVVGKGWTPANELRPGDRLACADRTTVAVEEVFDTGERELVYNLRVADYHTYFVGDEDWGWQVWAHNIYLAPVTVNGKVILAIREEETSSPKKSFVSADWSSSVQSSAQAYTYTSADATKVERINRLATAFMTALKPYLKSYKIRRGLFTTYGKGYHGDFNEIEGHGDNEDETEKTTGRDALFDALVYAPIHKNGRKRIKFDQAKAAFAAITAGAGLTGDDQWLAPEPQTDDAVLALAPTNQLHGYDLPQAADPLAVNNATNDPHKMAARYEKVLAYQVYKGSGEFTAGGEIVIWWGDTIGSGRSADAISVNPATGQVTLWDSKAYANGSKFIQSKTFTVEQRRNGAVTHARGKIETFPWKAEDATLKQQALASLANPTRNYKMVTVRYKPVSGPNAFTPLQTNMTPTPPPSNP